MTVFKALTVLIGYVALASSFSTISRQQHSLHRNTITKKSPNYKFQSSVSLRSTSLKAVTLSSVISSLPPVNVKDVWYQYALISSAAGMSLHLEKTTAFGKALSAPVCSMLLSVILTNLNILPADGSPHLKALVDFSVKLATPMLLLSADLKKTYKEAGATLLFAFFLGTVGTMLGSVIAYILFGAQIASSLGTMGDGWKLASALTAKNIGGGLNYMGVASALQLSPPAMATGLTVDNLLGLLYFPLISFVGSLSIDHGRTPTPAVESVSSSLQSNTSLATSLSTVPQAGSSSVPDSSPTISSMKVEPFLFALQLSLVIVAVSEYIGQAMHVPAITVSTILSVTLASLMPSMVAPLLPASDLVGKLLLMLFFAAIGNLSGTIYNAFFSPAIVPLIGFNTVLYAVHLAFIFGIGRIFKLKIPDLAIASNANIGNAATASALAVSKGWTRLIVPALLVGCLGNAIGTLLALSLGTNIFSKMFS